MLLAFVLIFVFLFGASVGSFLNVAIARLPLEKSLLWPNSRCGACHQSIRWFDNLPIFSYLWLRGRCRTCGQTYSSAYFFVELGTALGFLFLFWIEVRENIHLWHRDNPLIFRFGPLPWKSILGFGWHALLFSFLLAASVCDMKSREIPLQLTLTGTLIGVLGSALMPWPWPNAVPAAPIFPLELGTRIPQGIYAWPFWLPLPDWCSPGDNWQTGLATGVLGALVGTFLLRTIGFLFSTGLGKEALGLGDADLMMMAGSFLGWQVVVVAFFLSVIPALLSGIILLAVKNDNSLPFGPSLSLSVMATCLFWLPIGRVVQPFLFNGVLMLAAVVFGSVMMFTMSLALRMMRKKEGAEPVKPILIVDYGMANLRSVQKAFEKVGAAAIISADPNAIADADKLVLPGVGAFRDAIARLREANFVEPIKRHIDGGKPFLGICLGLQLLFTTSYEDGVHQGLDLFPGEIVRFDSVSGLKVPHMGWNQLHVRRPAPIFHDLPPEPAVYFVHSYYVKPKDPGIIAAQTDYPTPFASAIWQGNVMATQFHPEKSQKAGLAMLRQFAQWK